MFNAYTFDRNTHSRRPEQVSFSTTGGNQRATICVVSKPDDPAGSLRALLSVLVEDGFRVTWLELPTDDVHKTAISDVILSQHAQLAKLYKITQVFLPVQSACAYDWLRRHNFDFIIFHHGFGAAYYSCMAKRIGLAFCNIPVLIIAGSPFAKKLEESELFPQTYQHFEQNFLEKETVAKADALVCLNQGIFSWMEEADWKMPSILGIQGSGATLVPSFSKWLLEIIANQNAGTNHGPGDEKLFISVCLATYNRPQLLKEAIQSLSAQTYRDFEVIVIDDGSLDPEVNEVKNNLETLFKARGWRWEIQLNKGPSAARNHAANLAKGSHLLFMDDDNLAYPEELERFAIAAQSGVDILTCFLGMHPSSTMSFDPVALFPDKGNGSTRPLGWIPLGNCLELAPFVNRMGDTNSLIRRTTFLALGGFQGSREMVLEDFEFFVRASLAGFTIEVVPEILVLYHRSSDSRSMGHTIFRSHLDSLRPIAKTLPAPLRNLLLALRSEWYSRHCARRDGNRE